MSKPLPCVEVLFVCLGNICRSPMAEGIFRARVSEAGLADKFRIASCGIGNWHVGNPPDARAQAITASIGLDISGQRARQVSDDDFAAFDYVLGMDRANIAALAEMAPANSSAHVGLFLDFAAADVAARVGGEVPDPYYGGADGFAEVLALLQDASDGLLRHVSEAHRSDLSA